MAMSYRARKRLALAILILGLPAYIVVASSVVTWLGRPPVWVEFVVYIVLGIVWAIPCRRIFLGIGQADPDVPPEG